MYLIGQPGIKKGKRDKMTYLLRTSIVFLVLSINALAQTAKNVVFFSFDSDSFTASGKWAATSHDPKDEPAYPAEVQIDCFKGYRMCIHATAEYYMGNPHISIQYYDISKWDRDGIVAASTSAVCMSNTILINFADQSILSTYSPKKLDEKTKKACKDFGMEQSVIWTFVARGTDRWNKEHWKDILPAK
jgi:hypothetical protein